MVHTDSDLDRSRSADTSLGEVYARLAQIGRRGAAAGHNEEPLTDAFSGQSGEGLQLDDSAQPSARRHGNRGAVNNLVARAACGEQLCHQSEQIVHEERVRQGRRT